MTSYTCKGQRVRGAVSKYINMSAFLFIREEVEFVEAEIGVFAVRDHSDRELKRLRHLRSLYSWSTRRIVENEASARRNLLAFLWQKRTTCLSVGVKLYLKVLLLLFSCAKKVRARTYLKLGQGLHIKKTSLCTTVPITSNGRLGQRAWFKNDMKNFEVFFGSLSGVHTLRRVTTDTPRHRERKTPPEPLHLWEG